MKNSKSEIQPSIISNHMLIQTIQEEPLKLIVIQKQNRLRCPLCRYLQSAEQTILLSEKFIEVVTSSTLQTEPLHLFPHRSWHHSQRYLLDPV